MQGVRAGMRGECTHPEVQGVRAGVRGECTHPEVLERVHTGCQLVVHVVCALRATCAEGGTIRHSRGAELCGPLNTFVPAKQISQY